MKTKEELTAVKEEAETMNEKVRKLTDEELLLSSGAAGLDIDIGDRITAANDVTFVGDGTSGISDSSFTSGAWKTGEAAAEAAAWIKSDI